MNIRNGIDGLAQIAAQETASSSTSNKAVQAAKESSASGVSDQAHLSSAATELSTSEASSEVRFDKVASIQSALQAGTYHVDASDVAKKVVSALLSSEG